MTRAEITALIVWQTGARVQRGPFAGMHLGSESSWGDGDIGPKLLGTYEQELHQTIFEFLPNQYEAIVDVGSAEGFYAVGMARLFQNTMVHAFDTNQVSHPILQENARLNGVADCIQVGGNCDGFLLENLATGRRLLVIMDCEGGELELFRHQPVARALQHSDLIIECHDFVTEGTTGELVTRLFTTHLIEIVYSGGRNPTSYSFLANLSDWDRWVAVLENRPVLMNWIVCRSKKPVPAASGG